MNNEARVLRPCLYFMGSNSTPKHEDCGFCMVGTCKVRVTLNDLNASDEVLRISAWDISTLVAGRWGWRLDRQILYQLFL